MEIDLGFPALALVTTQDTAGILRRTSGTLVSATKATLISQGWAQYRVLQMEKTSIQPSLVLVLRGRRFLLFAVRFLTGLSPLTCLGATSDLERIFASKISLRAVAVTPLPGFLACRPWQAAFGLVWELSHTDCGESSSRHQGTRTSPCFSAAVAVNFHGFS